jgi:CRP-like cAMP-binding protein
MDNIVIEFLNNFNVLTDDEKKQIAERLKIQQYKKGEIIIREGQISKECYFVLKGCIRQYFLVDGVEKTTGFFTEMETAITGNAISNPMVSNCFLVSEEDTVSIVGNAEDEKSMFADFPKLESITREMMENDLGQTQQKLAAFIISSPEERYITLLDSRPDLFQRVPQHQIASYLGISPESLSRMRKRIADKRKIIPYG